MKNALTLTDNPFTRMLARVSPSSRRDERSGQKGKGGNPAVRMQVVEAPKIDLKGSYSIADANRTVRKLGMAVPGLPIDRLGRVPTIIPLAISPTRISVGRSRNRWLNDVGAAPDFASYLSTISATMGNFYDREVGTLAAGTVTIEVNNLVGDLPMPGLIVDISPPHNSVSGIDPNLNFTVTGLQNSSGAVAAPITFRWDGDPVVQTRFMLLFGQPNPNEGQAGYPDALLSRLAASANRLTVVATGSTGITVGVQTLDRSASEFDWLRLMGTSADLVNPELVSE